ncbi:conserved hypothetical protein [Halorhabdus utahensis DSM 12940]|uniref:Uncharacterized protein n=1 Tax=Halorhabdus utahensis (strain DSM 12940 / JCM 11049 / AX-2) TaxID=519442 RepID=C7NM72_HALUD|nr:hypothetical protein [Halorhabdus utahensis]ACV11280.1 conserved hypothetical protein [Halorhabdus utahensis DSM 12940]
MPENDPAISTRDVGVVARTGVALKIAGTRWDTRLAFLGASLLYVVVYLFTVGDLSVITGSEGVTVRIADDLSRALVSRGFFRFDAIALVSVGPVSYLFAPLNLIVASVLAGLVGANVALTYLGYTQPRACGLESSTGVLAGIPALLSGAACCGPTILVVIGVQASATLITAFRLLVPIAIVLLVGGLLLIGRQIDPGLL